MDLNEQVVIMDTSSPYYGMRGEIVGYSEIEFQGRATLYYFVAFAGVDKCPPFQTWQLADDQGDTECPAPLVYAGGDRLVDSPIQGAPEYWEPPVWDEFRAFIPRSPRQLDREQPGGYDYEPCGLPPVTNELDGLE